MHTTLCGHADSTPDFVAQWYHDRGYNFLVLSEHNKFIDPSTVNLKGELRDDFLLVPGEEVTGPVHSTAMNINRLVPWQFKDENRSKIIQNHVDEIGKAKGAMILNHPNFGRRLHSHEIHPVKSFICSNFITLIHMYIVLETPIVQVWNSCGTHSLKKV